MSRFTSASEVPGTKVGSAADSACSRRLRMCDSDIEFILPPAGVSGNCAAVVGDLGALLRCCNRLEHRVLSVQPSGCEERACVHVRLLDPPSPWVDASRVADEQQQWGERAKHSHWLVEAVEE